MASDETMTFQSSLQDEDFDDDIIDDGFDHHHLQHPHPHNLSRLSVCTSSVDDVDDVDDVDNAMTMYVSRLSLESFEGDGDADGELSDGKEDGLLMSSDSENEEVGSCYSLPATPPRRRNGVVGLDLDGNNKGAKDYASDNEAQNGVFMGREKAKSSDQRRRRRSNRRSVKRERWVFDPPAANSEKKKEEEHGSVGGFSGDSDQSGGTGVVLITRPKGGKRSLCMGLEEVKACRDLGFELEHERMLEMPSSRLSFSNSTIETTSSGSNSPIANWRISGPGDDPRDVKARLKVWAQAVALASASKYGT